MMKILFLDDDQTRHDTISNVLGDRHEIVHVYTAAAAIGKLKEDVYDLVMLDHDLGLNPAWEGLYEDDDEPDGRVVVDWMVKNMKVKTPVIVHSWNSARAPEMEASLSEGGFQVRRIAFAKDWLKDLY